MIRIGLISNPQSRRNRRGLQAIEDLARRRDDVLHRRLEPGTAPGEVLAEFARHEVSILAINGGDGTVQKLLTALLLERPFASLPMLAPLAGGTTNSIAGDIGLGGAPVRGLGRLLELAREGRIDRAVRARHVMRVDHLQDEQPQYGLFLAGGAVARAIAMHRDRHADSDLPGPLLLARTLVRVLADWGRPAAARRIIRGENVGLALDGGESAQACRLVLLVTTLERLVLGARPYWNQTGEPLRLTSVACRPRRLLRSLVRVMILHRDGATLPADSYESHSARRVELAGTSALALDGELFRPRPDRPVVVTACGPLRFVTG